MATTYNQLVSYKTATRIVPAIITRTYTLSGSTYTQVGNVAYSDSSVDAADLLVLGYQPVEVKKAPKETGASASEGAVTAANAGADGVNLTRGSWSVIT